MEIREGGGDVYCLPFLKMYSYEPIFINIETGDTLFNYSTNLFLAKLIPIRIYNRHQIPMIQICYMDKISILCCIRMDQLVNQIRHELCRNPLISVHPTFNQNPSFCSWSFDTNSVDISTLSRLPDGVQFDYAWVFQGCVRQPLVDIV